MTKDANMTHSVQAQLLQEAYRVQLGNGQHQWWVDEPEALGGGNTAPNPMEMLLSALGACTAVTLKMYAEHKNWDVQDVQVDLSLAEADKTQPKQARLIVRHLHITGNLDEAQKARLFKVAESCPVHKLLVGDIQIQTILEDGFEGLKQPT